MKTLEDYDGAQKYAFALLHPDLSQASVELFERVWPTILSELVRTWSTKDALEIFAAGGIHHNGYLDRLGTGVNATFAPDAYSEAEARQDLDAAFEQASQDEASQRFIQGIEIRFQQSDFTYEVQEFDDDELDTNDDELEAGQERSDN